MHVCMCARAGMWIDDAVHIDWRRWIGSTVRGDGIGHNYLGTAYAIMECALAAVGHNYIVMAYAMMECTPTEVGHNSIARACAIIKRMLTEVACTYVVMPYAMMQPIIYRIVAVCVSTCHLAMMPAGAQFHLQCQCWRILRGISTEWLHRKCLGRPELFRRKIRCGGCRRGL